VFCGKVYLNLFKQPDVFSTHGEFQTALEVHGDYPHPNIVKIYQTIEFSHESTSSEPGLLALILPLYPMSLADIMEAFGQTVLSYDFFYCVAHGLLSAGARFQEKNLSHCDLKPENVMMNNCH
jgi:serine/threonine protein kinase